MMETMGQELEYPFRDWQGLDAVGRSAVWEAGLVRLARLAGTDPGLFVLGAFALVEAWLTAYHRGDDSFPAECGLSEKAGYHLFQHGRDKYLHYFNILKEFRGGVGIPNAVRHNFALCPAEPAGIAAANLVSLSRKAELAGIKATEEFWRKVSGWQPPVDLGALLSELERTQRDLEASKTSEQEARAAALALAHRENDMAALKSALQAAEAEARFRGEVAQKRDEKIDGLRRQLREMEQAQRQDTTAARYVQTLLRAHRFSRSSLEFQQALLRLSIEQEEALGAFKPGENFLIRGGAGTGKTLVLLAALKRLRTSETTSLGYELPQQVTLLTYSRTLRRYTLWLLRLLDGGLAEDRVQTIDAYLLTLHQELVAPSHRLVYKNARAELAPDVPEEVWEELEGFVWARGLSRAEYVERVVPRTGRKKPLRAERRAEVWEAGEKALASMETQGKFSRAALRFRLLSELERRPKLPKRGVFAVDEVQDLLPVELMLIGKVADSVLMAGDASQSVFNAGFRFSDAGIDLAGRSRTLKLSYRSTRPLSRLAMRFLETAGTDIPERTGTESHRDGMPPVLERYNGPGDVTRALTDALKYYTQLLGYEPSSIAILAPLHDALKTAEDAARELGLASVDVHATEEWMEQNAVRICTVQSAKGLDFPVVIALLPKLHYDETLDDATRHAQKASVVYVAITRALENLTVLLPSQTNDTALKAFAAAFGEG